MDDLTDSPSGRRTVGYHGRMMHSATSPLRHAGALPLAAADIHLWLADYQQVTDPGHLHAMRELLCEAEREREAAFRFADDRLRYRVTRAMLRTVLSRYAGVAPAAWEFALNPYGRPELAARHELPGLHFNLSHTRGLIALAVGCSREIGVDVEHLAERPAPLDIAEHFFSPAEAAALAALPQARRAERFFEYWTFKEAYIKARGMGLSLPLNRFSMQFDGAHLAGMTADAALDEDPGRWRFWQCRPAPHYLLALCAAGGAGPAPRVTVRRLTPGFDAIPADIDWPIAPGSR